MADDTYKFFGLLAVCILAGGLAYVIIKWPNSKHATFSQHIALRRQSIIYYAALFSVVLSLLLLFFLKWFVPSLQLSTWFNVLIVASSAAQLMCTFIPEVGGRLSTYHRLLAGVSALLLIPALIVLLFSDAIGVIDKFVLVVSLVAMLLIVFVVSLRKGEPRYFLLLQIAYFMAFFIPIMTVAYLR